MEKMIYDTNFLVAVNWLNGDLILCNNIEEIDSSIYENLYNELASSLEDDEEEDFEGVEIYQWFLTNYSSHDVEFLKEHFNLFFVYSDLLDLWVLAVTHYGTSWDYVYWTTDIKNAKRELGERK